MPNNEEMVMMAAAHAVMFSDPAVILENEKAAAFVKKMSKLLAQWERGLVIPMELAYHAEELVIDFDEELVNVWSD